MSEFDQNRAILNAGTTPQKKPRPKITPLKEDYVPSEGEDEIVRLAYAKKRLDQEKQAEEVRTVGRQPGYTKLDCEDIADS